VLQVYYDERGGRYDRFNLFAIQCKTSIQNRQCARGEPIHRESKGRLIFRKGDIQAILLFAGYYRVNYNKENWELLAKHLNNIKDNKFGSISAVTRAQLIDDALNLARAGHMNYETSLGMTLYLEHENDYIPWHAATRAFDYLDKLLQSTKKYKLFKVSRRRRPHSFIDRIRKRANGHFENLFGKFQRYVAHKVQSFAKEIENVASNETHVNKLAKVLALKTACRYGVEQCQIFAEKKLKEWLEDDKQENK